MKVEVVVVEWADFFSYSRQTRLLSGGGAAGAAGAAGCSKEMKWGERWVRYKETGEEEGEPRWCS